MSVYDMEVGLYADGPETYSVEIRLTPPENDYEVRLLSGRRAPVQLRHGALQQLSLDRVAYGCELSASLFGHPEVRQAFEEAYSVSQAQTTTLRFRLLLDVTRPELHGLPWETLRSPIDSTLLATNERILFSRYLSSSEWRPVRLREPGELRSVVMVASPSDLGQYRLGHRALASLDVAGEVDRATRGLPGRDITVLAGPRRATLNNLSAALREGCDILYLVCHGNLNEGRPQLWLEDEEGRVRRTAGSELVERIKELAGLPRLVVVASCQSAGVGDTLHSEDEGALAALGPQLAEAGVPAVVAMQGNITMTTVARFMPVFFEELCRDGQSDRAMAVARGAVRDRPDSWVPALFMRLRNGQLWRAAAPPQGGFRKETWLVLLDRIRSGQCTPILGPGMYQALLGSRRDIARRWADLYQFPLGPEGRDELPRVAQYLAVHEDPMYPFNTLERYLQRWAWHRYGDDLSLDPDLEDARLDEVTRAVGRHLRGRDPAEPHKVLAELPFPVYVTTNPGNTLLDALREAGKEPRRELCVWNEDCVWPENLDRDSSRRRRPASRPSPDCPLVYYLFGHLEVPSSLVLTEDDYFDYLIGVTNNWERIPSAVRFAFANSALLFLGFQMDDWNFRTLLRIIRGQEGRHLRRNYHHIAAQVDPDADQVLDAERARRYLESYFKGADIRVYWGSVEEFVRNLRQQGLVYGARG